MMSVVSRLALTAALLGSLVAPVVAVSYLHTPEGVEYLEQPSIAAWVAPATALLRPLLDGLLWHDPFMLLADSGIPESD